jgi:tRNA(adenine34) deaminase
MTNETMMRRAIELAESAAALDEVPVGAVVHLDGEIVGEGFNRREVDHDPLAHAEMLAIADAATRLGRWRLHDCSIVVTLEPCPMCAGAIVNARLDEVVFGARDAKSGASRSLYEITDDPRLNHRCEVVEGVLEDECVALLQDFFKAKR